MANLERVTDGHPVRRCNAVKNLERKKCTESEKEKNARHEVVAKRFGEYK